MYTSYNISCSLSYKHGSALRSSPYVLVLLYLLSNLQLQAQLPPEYDPTVWVSSFRDTSGGMIVEDRYIYGHTIDDSLWIVLSSNKMHSIPTMRSGDLVILSSTNGQVLHRDSLCPSTRLIGGWESILTVSMTDSTNVICYTCYGENAQMRAYPSLDTIYEPLLSSKGRAMISHTGRYLACLPSSGVGTADGVVDQGVATIYDRYTGDSATVETYWDHRMTFSRNDRYFVCSVGQPAGIGAVRRPAVFDLQSWEFIGDTIPYDPRWVHNPPRVLSVDGGSADYMLSDDGETIAVVSESSDQHGNGMCIVINLVNYDTLSLIPMLPYGYYPYPGPYYYSVSIDSTTNSIYINQPLYDSVAKIVVYDWYRYVAYSDTPSVHYTNTLRIGAPLRQTKDARMYHAWNNYVIAYDTDMPAPVIEYYGSHGALSPNPVDQSATILIQPATSDTVQVIVVSIASGQTVKQFIAAADDNIYVDTHDIASGAYHVVCMSHSGNVLYQTNIIVAH